MEHLGDLGDNLKKKIEAEKQRLSETAEHQHQELQQQLKAQSRESLTNFRQELENWLKAERNTITRAMEENHRIFKKYLIGQWIWMSVTAMSLCLGILGGSWGLIGFSTMRITQKQTQLEQIEREIKQQEETLNQLQNQTLGIKIGETSNGTFITPPPYQQLTPGWTCQGQPCLKLE
jgi:exonuclease VII large subunit